jgi:hypothetical protein
LNAHVLAAKRLASMLNAAALVRLRDEAVADSRCALLRAAHAIDRADEAALETARIRIHIADARLRQAEELLEQFARFPMVHSC